MISSNEKELMLTMKLLSSQYLEGIYKFVIILLQWIKSEYFLTDFMIRLSALNCFSGLVLGWCYDMGMLSRTLLKTLTADLTLALTKHFHQLLSARLLGSWSDLWCGVTSWEWALRLDVAISSWYLCSDMCWPTDAMSARSYKLILLIVGIFCVRTCVHYKLLNTQV